MNKNASLGGLLAFISNPAFLAVVGIGAAVLTIMEMFSEEEDDQDNGSEAVPNGSTPLPEPPKGVVLTVPATVTEPFETVEITVEPAVYSSVEDRYVTEVFEDSTDDLQQGEVVHGEAAKKEMIRQAMSELGKRSAAARAKKKSNTEE